MSTLQERMEDAQFEVHTPICLFCLNRRKILHEPYVCAVKSEVPYDVRYACSVKCKEFLLDEMEWILNKPLMPEDFDPKTIAE